MPRVTPRHPNENFEALLGRFKRAVEKSGILEDYHAHEFYEKPSMTRARNKAAAIKREQRLTREMKARRLPS